MYLICGQRKNLGEHCTLTQGPLAWIVQLEALVRGLDQGGTRLQRTGHHAVVHEVDADLIRAARQRLINIGGRTLLEVHAQIVGARVVNRQRVRIQRPR